MESYDNDELYHEENQADDVPQQPGVTSDEDDAYVDQNYNDDDDDYQDQDDGNDSDGYENGPRAMGGHYYTYYDADGKFVRTNTIRK